MRGKFVRCRPARLFRGSTEFFLLRDGIYLHHDAIDLVRNLLASRQPLLVVSNYRFKRIVAFGMRIALETELLHLFKGIHVRCEFKPLRIGEGIDEDIQRPRGGDGGI